MLVVGYSYMTQDIFDEWNIEKKEIHGREFSGEFFVNSREIWFIKMGKNIGYEENGKDEFARPVLVIKKAGNLFFTVALTTKGKMENRFYHKLDKVHFIDQHIHNKENSFAILSQARVFDKRRFLERIGYLQEAEFAELKQKLTAILL